MSIKRRLFEEFISPESIQAYSQTFQSERKARSEYNHRRFINYKSSRPRQKRGKR